MFENEKLVVDQQTGSLTFNQVTVESEGRYMCIVETRKQTSARSSPVNLNVIGKLYSEMLLNMLWGLNIFVMLCI